MRTLFESVKDAVDLTDAAQRYGLRIDAHGKALCPFHSEKTPSFSVKGQLWHCFGCGESGDVITLVQRLTGARKSIDAVKRLNDDYRLGLEVGVESSVNDKRRREEAAMRDRDRKTLEAFEAWERSASVAWAAYCRTLEAWKHELAPQSPDEPLDPRFVEACHRLDYADYVFTKVFIEGTFEDKLNYYIHYHERVAEIERRFKPER